jgi:hypothetical protein
LYKYLNVGISFFENQNPGTFNNIGVGAGRRRQDSFNQSCNRKTE